MPDADIPESFDQFRDQFEDECVLVALDRARSPHSKKGKDVFMLDEDTGRLYRVLNATRGSPDSGWFVLALAGPNPNDGFETQHRIHDSDTHRVLIVNPETVAQQGDA